MRTSPKFTSPKWDSKVTYDMGLNLGMKQESVPFSFQKEADYTASATCGA